MENIEIKKIIFSANKCKSIARENLILVNYFIIK